MEIFGGFMAMMSMVSLFLAIVWLIMPFVVFAIKGKQERTLEILEEMKQQMCRLEQQLEVLKSQQLFTQADTMECVATETIPCPEESAAL